LSSRGLVGKVGADHELNMKEETMSQLDQLIERYVAVWTEPDADRRRAAIAELWTEDGAHILEPPEEIRNGAAALAMSAQLVARGHAALEERVTRAYEQFIAPGEYIFRSRQNAKRLDDVVTFNWEMVTTAGGEVAGVGLDFLVLGADGRIRIDYQFIES
jgi:hypothetical protein